MAKQRQPTSAPSDFSPDTLPGAVTRLADELRLLREVLDELREDFSWVTRNGLPVQPVEQVIVRRTALDPTDPDWNRKLQLTLLELPNDSEKVVGSDALEELAVRLVESFAGIAQGQLEIVLTALDSVRSQFAAAFDAATPSPASPSSGSRPQAQKAEAPPPRQGEGPRDVPPGCLF